MGELAFVFSLLISMEVRHSLLLLTGVKSLNTIVLLSNLVGLNKKKNLQNYPVC